MNASTRYNHMRRLKGKIVDIHSRARIYRLCHGKILDLYDRGIYKDAGFARLPQWAKSSLFAFLEGHKATLDHHIHWRVLLDGFYILGKDVPNGRWAEVEPGSHFWNEPDHKGYLHSFHHDFSTSLWCNEVISSQGKYATKAKD